MCDWRMHQAEWFGEEQAILHIAHKLVAAQEVWRPAARAWAHEARVRWANGEQMIELTDGSRWMIQAANDGAGVSFTLSMALVDEAWRVNREVVDEAIMPTMAESASPQLWLVSTAGTSSSDLMLVNRAAALAELDEPRPGSTLLLEWSAPPDPDLDIDDPGVWRAFAPHWDGGGGEERMRTARAKVTERAFRQQWLNQWVPSAESPLLDEAVVHGGADAGRAVRAGELRGRGDAGPVGGDDRGVRRRDAGRGRGAVGCGVGGAVPAGAGGPARRGGGGVRRVWARRRMWAWTCGTGSARR